MYIYVHKKRQLYSIIWSVNASHIITILVKWSTFFYPFGPFFDSHLVSAPGLSGEGGKPWDYAAGTIIAMEAGAKFCNLQGAVVGSTP